MRTRAALFLLCPSLLLACGATEDEAPAVVDVADAPLLGADGVDAPDHACHVVLRRAARALRDDGLPETDCSTGACYFVWAVDVDVSRAALAEGVRPGLLYSPSSEPTWYEVGGEPAGAAGEGFETWRFRLAARTVRADLSGTALGRAQLELIPFVQTRLGPRIFDHNVHPEPLRNYVLGADADFAHGTDPGVCAVPPAGETAPEATLRFGADYTHEQVGTLRAGEQFVIDYDLRRLPQCANDRYMGRPSWNTNAYVRFSGATDDTVSNQPLLDCADAACADPASRPVVFEIPEGAEAVEVWFATAGRSCGVHWDSDFGRNYRFEVKRRPGWVGGFTYKSTRAGGDPCEGGGAVEDGVGFGTWNRTRAVFSNLCFQAWVPGVTDRGGRVDAWVECRWDGDETWRSHGLTDVGQVGNDRRFALALSGLDPLAPYRCPDVATEVRDGYERAGAECVAVVEGFEYGPEGEGDRFRLEFADYPNNDFRANRCP